MMNGESTSHSPVQRYLSSTDFMSQCLCVKVSKTLARPRVLDSRLKAEVRFSPLSTHFAYRLSRPQGSNAVRRIRPIEISNDVNGDITNDLAACGNVRQPTTLPGTPILSLLLFS